MTTKEQQYVIENALKFEKQVCKIGGYAGTGKSYCLDFINRFLKNKFAVCAYTGKAANVLTRRKVPATTIHGLIYSIVMKNGYPLIKNGMPVFEKKDKLEYDGILVDEASMISKELYEDLISFNIPVIFFGDHGQLEPIGDSINLMKEPDYRLEQIHRNAGPIAYFAEYIRKGYRPASFRDCKEVKFVQPYEAKEILLRENQRNFQSICAYNNFRCEGNKFYRKEKGFNEHSPQVDDKIICLKNNKNFQVFNGMQGFVTKIHKKGRKSLINFKTYDYEFKDIAYFPNQFNKPKLDNLYNSKTIPFDYAYLQTCHKCQGDEYDNVLVFEQRSKLWDHTRWCNTAATRAKKQVYWCEQNVRFI